MLPKALNLNCKLNVIAYFANEPEASSLCCDVLKKCLLME